MVFFKGGGVKGLTFDFKVTMLLLALSDEVTERGVCYKMMTKSQKELEPMT
jgi:hypothetical protein